MAAHGFEPARARVERGRHAALARRRRSPLTRGAGLFFRTGILPTGGRPLLRGIQRQLEGFYGLELDSDVVEFVRPVDDAERETLLVREREGELELALLLRGRLLDEEREHPDRDGLLQAFEGVSHFVYLAERARTELPTTRLELELQAEVDKFVLLALSGGRLELDQRDHWCEHLFERVRFLHSEGSEDGARYRLANTLAARFVRRLDMRAPGLLKERLRRFYRAGQADKIRLANAA